MTWSHPSSPAASPGWVRGLGWVGLAALALALGYHATVVQPAALVDSPDGARDLLRVHAWLHGGGLDLRGPEIGNANVGLGPGWYVFAGGVLAIWASPVAIYAAHVLLLAAGLLALGVGLARRVGPWPALLCCALLGTSRYVTDSLPVIWHAAAFPGLAALWLAGLVGIAVPRTEERPGVGPRLLAQWILTALMFQCHMSAAAYAVILALLHLHRLWRGGWRTQLGWHLASLLIAIGLAVGYGLVLGSVADQAVAHGSTPLGDRVGHALPGIWAGLADGIAPSGHGDWMAWVTLALATLGVLRGHALRAWLAGLLAVGFLVGLGMAQDGWAPRYANAVLPALFALAALGASTLLSWLPAWAALGPLVVISTAIAGLPAPSQVVAQGPPAVVELDALMQELAARGAGWDTVSRAVHGPLFTNPFVRYAVRAHGLDAAVGGHARPLWVGPEGMAGAPQGAPIIGRVPGSGRILELRQVPERLDTPLLRARAGDRPCVLPIPLHRAPITNGVIVNGGLYTLEGDCLQQDFEEALELSVHIPALRGSPPVWLMLGWQDSDRTPCIGATVAVIDGLGGRQQPRARCLEPGLGAWQIDVADGVPVTIRIDYRGAPARLVLVDLY